MSDKYKFLELVPPAWVGEAADKMRAAFRLGQTPPPVRAPAARAWWCFAGPRRVVETIEPPYPWMPPKTFVIDFCGAPPGVRCSCGTQLDGHDPGDEDRSGRAAAEIG